MLFGVLGAIVIWKPTFKAKMVGFELWAVSNVAWIATAYLGVDMREYALPLLIMNGVYLLSNVAGIYTHQIFAIAEDNLEAQRKELLKMPEKRG